MRIGVDICAWANNRGFGRFTRELVAAMAAEGRGHRLVLLTDDPGFEAGLDGVETRVAGTRRRTTAAATARDRRSVPDMLALRRLAAGSGLDLMFYPAVYSWFPPPRGLPTVVAFHDAIAERFPELVFPHLANRLAWGAKTALARLSAARVMTVSETARRDIVAKFGIPRARIDVITEGAGEVFRPVADIGRRREVRARHGIPEDARTLVYVGGFAPHKNLERLVAAFAAAAARPGCGDLVLVMVGDPGGGGFHSNHDAVVAAARAVPGGRVVFPGYVPDADLAALYSDCLALVLPSLAEGFGLPALEAMCCGAPVLAARDEAVIEVAGSAGLAFDPRDAGDIARAIEAIATRPGLAAALAARTAEECGRHGWDRAAALALDSLERARAEVRCAS